MPSWIDPQPVAHNISPFSKDCVGEALLGLNNAALSATVSTAWVTGNLALFFPVYLSGRFNVARFTWNNGATVSGNIDMGLYSWKGSLLISTGATAQASVNVQQTVDVTDVVHGPGDFWLAIMATSGTATFFGNTLTAPYQRLAGVQQMATSGTLPATATFAAASTLALVPVCSMTDRSA